MNKVGKIKNYKSSEISDSYVSIGFECLDRELFKPEMCYDLLAQSGVKYARVQTGWIRCERQAGVYDFVWLDDIVDNLIKRGVTPWFDVGFGNPLYMDNTPNKYCVGCVPLLFGDRAVSAWESYVSALAEHYKDRIDLYEIWNEPDLEAFWYPGKPDAVSLARLLEITSDIIKKHHPTAKTGTNMSHAFGKPVYLDTLLKNLPARCLDFFCCHMYEVMPEKDCNERYGALRKQLDDNGFAHTEIWQGEGGYPSWAYKNHWLVPEGCDDERAQAVYQFRRYFIDVYNGCKISSFFQMADMWEKPYPKARDFIEKPAGHGILRGKTYEPKESYRTISHLAAFFSGNIKPAKKPIGVQIKEEGEVRQIQVQTFTFEKNGGSVYAYYIPLPLNVSEALPYTAEVKTETRFLCPVLIDMYTGEVFEIESRFRRDEDTVFENLPVKNYPLVIADKGLFETE